jgi:hypothetical protein
MNYKTYVNFLHYYVPGTFIRWVRQYEEWNCFVSISLYVLPLVLREECILNYLNITVVYYRRAYGDYIRRVLD